MGVVCSVGLDTTSYSGSSCELLSHTTSVGEGGCVYWFVLVAGVLGVHVLEQFGRNKYC